MNVQWESIGMIVALFGGMSWIVREMRKMGNSKFSRVLDKIDEMTDNLRELTNEIRNHPGVVPRNRGDRDD